MILFVPGGRKVNLGFSAYKSSDHSKYVAAAAEMKKRSGGNRASFLWKSIKPFIDS